MTWLVIANSTKAQIHKIEQHKATLIETLNHPESRLKSGELTSDEAGHYKSSNGAHGQYQPPSDAHEKEQEYFANEIAKFLEKGRQKNRYGTLIICAAPHFHGLINQAISDPVKLLIKKSIKKDYIPLPANELNEVIEKIANEKIRKSS